MAGVPEGGVVARSPLEPLDKACLAATRAPWASFAPTWRLSVRGPLSREALAQALAWLVVRYPWCAARVEDSAWVVRAGPGFAPPLDVLDLRGAPAGDLDAQEAALVARPLDPTVEAPLRLSWVRHADELGTLAFQQHHALADGRAFLSLLGDFMACLAAAREGATRSPLPAGVVARAPERWSLVERGLARWGAALAGAWASLREALTAALSPLTPLASNTPRDFSGPDRTRHLLLPLARLTAWRPHQQRLGLSLHALLSGALVVALHRWSTARGGTSGTHNLLTPVDVRSPAQAASFANHLGAVQVRWRVGPGDTPLSLAQRLHPALAGPLARRLPWKRVPFDGWLVRLTPLATLRRALLDGRRLLTCWSFSNLIALPVPGVDADGLWRAGGLTVEQVRITTPCTPPQAANLTVLRYGAHVCFNFNWKAPALDEAAVTALTREFERALDELDAALLLR